MFYIGGVKSVRINSITGISYVVLLIIGTLLSFTMMIGPSLLLLTTICLIANLGYTLLKESRYILVDETAYGESRFIVGTLAGVFGMFLIVTAFLGLGILLF